MTSLATLCLFLVTWFHYHSAHRLSIVTNVLCWYRTWNSPLSEPASRFLSWRQGNWFDTETFNYVCVCSEYPNKNVKEKRESSLSFNFALSVGCECLLHQQCKTRKDDWEMCVWMSNKLKPADVEPWGEGRRLKAGRGNRCDHIRFMTLCLDCRLMKIPLADGGK